MKLMSLKQNKVVTSTTNLVIVNHIIIIFLFIMRSQGFIVKKNHLKMSCCFII